LSASRAFSGVTVAVVNRIKQVAHGEHGIVFDPHDGTKGTAIARTPIGNFVMDFVHDAARSVLVLTLVKKPVLLPAVLVWNRLGTEVERFKRMP
jgi:hypothetical protein